MATPLRVLIAEDRQTDAELMVYELRQAGFDPDWKRVDNERDYLTHLDDSIDLVLADHSMPEFDSPRALRLLQERGLDIPLIVVTGSIGEEKAVDLIRRGASDYLLKDRLARLGEAAKRALEQRRLRQERRQAEAALRESYARLSAFARALPDLSFILDAAGTYIDVLARQNGLLVSGADDLTGRRVHDVLPADQADLIVNAVRATIRSGATQIIEYSLEVPAGLRWFEGHTALMDSAPAEAARVVLVVRDITQRKQAEDLAQGASAALGRRNQRLSTLYHVGKVVNSTLDVDQILSYLADESMRVTQATHALVLLADPAKGYFERRSLHGFTPEETRRAEDLRLRLDQGLNGEAYQTREIVRVDDVRTRPEYYNLIESTRSELVVPILRHGEALGNIDLQRPEVGAFREADIDYLEALAEQAALAITNARLYHELEVYSGVLEQAVAERTAEVEATKDRVETILSSVGDGLLVLRMDGRIEQVNSAFERQTGYSAVEAEMKDHHDLLQLEFGSKGDYQAALETLTPGQVWQGETKVHRKDGSAYDASLTVAPVRNEKGEIRLLVAIIRDITPLKEVERAKDQFVSNVSHELRTPITSLRLTRDLMRRNPAKLDVYMERLHRDIERLNVLIEDLLRLSRLQQGRTELDLKPFDVNALAAQYVEDRAPLAESRQLTMALDSTPDLPLVAADTGLLWQALSVLVTNALNYTPAGGKVTIGTHLRQAEDGRWAGFSVSDTGPGIPPDELPQLFMRFFRGSVGRESGASGTGLGLAIAKEIVERHAGRIEIVSEGIPGKGAAFYVWLPVEHPLPDDKEEK